MPPYPAAASLPTPRTSKTVSLCCVSKPVAEHLTSCSCKPGETLFEPLGVGLVTCRRYMNSRCPTMYASAATVKQLKDAAAVPKHTVLLRLITLNCAWQTAKHFCLPDPVLKGLYSLRDVHSLDLVPDTPFHGVFSLANLHAPTTSSAQPLLSLRLPHLLPPDPPALRHAVRYGLKKASHTSLLTQAADRLAHLEHGGHQPEQGLWLHRLRHLAQRAQGSDPVPGLPAQQVQRLAAGLAARMQRRPDSPLHPQQEGVRLCPHDHASGPLCPQQSRHVVPQPHHVDPSGRTTRSGWACTQSKIG